MLEVIGWFETILACKDILTFGEMNRVPLGAGSGVGVEDWNQQNILYWLENNR